MGAALRLEQLEVLELRREKARPQFKLVVGGAFLQKDPAPGKLTVPISVVNAYAYGGNNPILNTDPTGMSFLGNLFHDIFSSVIGKILIAVAITAAAVATGGAAAALAVSALSIQSAVAGAVVGAVVGAAVGGVTGGLIGGGIAVLSGTGTFGQGFMSGFVTGAIAGGIAGGIQGYQQAGLNANVTETQEAIKDPANRVAEFARDRSETDYEFFETRRAADAYGPQEYLEPGLMKPRFPVLNPNCVPIMAVPLPGLPGIIVKGAACFIFG